MIQELRKRDHYPPRGAAAIATTIYYMIVASITAGVIVGYGQLKPMLIDSKIYFELCTPDTVEKNQCKAQQAALDNMFSVGAAVSIFAQAPSGAMLDFLGPKIMSWLGLLLLIVGSIVFALSSATFDGYLAGFIFLSGGGPFIFVSTLHTAALFPLKTAFIMALLNGSFSAGALLFFVFNSLFYNYSISLKALFLAYAVLCGVIMITTFFFWPWGKWTEPKIAVVTTSEPRSGIITEDRGIISEPINDNDSILNDSQFNDMLKVDDYWGKFRKNAFNFHYLFIVIYIPLMICNGNFFLATSDQQLELITKNNHELTLYGSILAIMIPVVGILSSPLGLLFDRYGINFSIFFFVFCCIMSTALGVVKNLEIQIVRYILFSVYYPYTYTVWADFLTKKFGLSTFGLQFGIIAAVAAVEQFALTPLVNYAVLTNSYNWVNIGWIILTLLGLIYPVVIIFTPRSIKLNSF